MKILPLLLLLMTIAGCKKSEDSSVVPSGTNCVLTHLYFSDYMLQGSVLYLHDSSGKILSQKGHPWMTDTTTRYYAYTGNSLQYSYCYEDAANTDTTYYYYDELDRLVKTTYHTLDLPFEYIGRTDFVYNTANQVIYTVMRLDTSTAIAFSDSSVYTYTEGNVTQITSYWMNGDEMVSHTQHLSYDSMKNYYRAMKVPYVSHEYWSKNNITLIDGDSGYDQHITITYSNYNAAGYPTKAVFLSSLNGISRNQEMGYECE